MIDRMYRQAGLLIVALLVLILAPILAAQIIRETGPVPILGAIGVVSIWAYISRERGRRRQPGTAGQIAGAERTPVLPHEEEQ